MAPLILIVDSDAEHVRMITDALQQADYLTDHVETAGEGMSAFSKREPALVLTELDLPDEDGMLFLSRIRDHGVVPIIVCTTRQTQADRVLPLKLGADDVMIKPIVSAELVERVRAVLRRAIKTPSVLIHCGRLLIHPKEPWLFFENRSVMATPVEHQIILYLGERYGRTVESKELIAAVWGTQDAWYSANLLSTHIWRLRQRLGSINASDVLKTVHGSGYMVFDEAFLEGDS